MYTDFINPNQVTKYTNSFEDYLNSNAASKTYGMTAKLSCSADVVFSFIQIRDNCLEIVLSCVVFIILSLVYEYVLNKKTKLLEEYNSSMIASNASEKIKITLVHALHITLLYVIMIGVMSYNIWIILAIILSNGFGYWIFMDYERKIEMGGCCNFN